MKNPKVFSSNFIFLLLIHYNLKAAVSLEIYVNISDTANNTIAKKNSDQSTPVVDIDGASSDNLKNMEKHNTSDHHDSQPVNTFDSYKHPATNNGSSDSSLVDRDIPIRNIPFQGIPAQHSAARIFPAQLPGSRMFPAQFPHKSILISKLNFPNPKYHSRLSPDVFSDMNNVELDPPVHSWYHPQDPILSLDPMFGILDRMMDSLMKPILNRPFNFPRLQVKQDANDKLVQPLTVPIDSEEDSSLKSWIQNENKITNYPKTLNKENVDKIEASISLNDDNSHASEEGADNSNYNDENPDYKTDLWKMFIEKKENTSEKSNIWDDENDTKSIEKKPHQSSNDDNNINDWFQSDRLTDGKQINKNNKNDANNINNEDAWWYRLISPGKPKILRDHKKSIHHDQGNTITGDDSTDKKESKKRESESLTNGRTKSNTHGKQILGSRSKVNDGKLGADMNNTNVNINKTVKARFMNHMYDNYDVILEVSIVGFFLTILLLVLKVSVLFYREYNLSRIIRQYDYYKFTPLVRSVQRTRRAPWSRTSPPPSYALHIPVPLPSDKP